MFKGLKSSLSFHSRWRKIPVKYGSIMDNTSFNTCEAIRTLNAM